MQKNSEVLTSQHIGTINIFVHVQLAQIVYTTDAVTTFLSALPQRSDLMTSLQHSVKRIVHRHNIAKRYLWFRRHKDEIKLLEYLDALNPPQGLKDRMASSRFFHTHG